MPQELIQGIVVKWRSLKEDERIHYSAYPPEEQYFRRVEIPFTDAELLGIAMREYKPTPIQQKWIDDQKYIFDHGIYAHINGELTFIPGAYYCYVNFWTLEHGEKPDYREDDRVFFLYHEYLRLETDILGITRLKGRRQGATSIAMFFMWFIGGRNEHALCGTTSFNDEAAASNFQKMFLFGFRALPPCFQEDFDSDSENYLKFQEKSERRTKNVLAVKKKGLNSYCDFKSNVISSYDSGRQTYNVPDEGGKRHKVNINAYWSRLYKTLVRGKKKVGFAYLPTTVGGKKEGGENYKKLYKNSNQYGRDKNGEVIGLNTPSRLVRYFVPATLCFEGCIDKFGKSVVDDPLEPVMGSDGQWITEGSRTIILRERSRLEGEELMDHRRDYPLDEYDAFAFEAGTCEFSEENIRRQMDWLEENRGEHFLRRVRLYQEDNGNVKFMDDDKGNWLLYEKPEEENLIDIIAGTYEARNTLRYCIGVDTFKGGFAQNGSKGTICVFKKSHIVDGKETGLYPVAFYVGHPRLVQHFYDEVLKACIWFGCKVNFEIDAGDAYYGHFLVRGAVRLLEWTPALDLSKKHPLLKPGTESASPYQLAAQLEAGKMYVDGTDPDGYNGNVHRIVFPDLLVQLLGYNHEERTPYDWCIALFMALLVALKQTKAPPPKGEQKTVPLPTYKLKIPA